MTGEGSFVPYSAYVLLFCGLFPGTNVLSLPPAFVLDIAAIEIESMLLSSFHLRRPVFILSLSRFSKAINFYSRSSHLKTIGRTERTGLNKKVGRPMNVPVFTQPVGDSFDEISKTRWKTHIMDFRRETTC